MTLIYNYAYTLNGLIVFLVFTTISGFALGALKRHCLFNRYALMLYYLSAFILIIGIILGYLGKYDLSMIVYTISLFAFCVSLEIFAIYKKNITIDASITIQLFIISFGIFVWYLSALISNISIKEYPSIVYTGLIIISSNLIIWSFNVFSSIKNISPINILRNNKMLFPVLISIALASFPIFNLPFMWDGADRFLSLMQAARWEFTLGTVSKLDLSSHRGGGYAFLTEIGVWAFKDPIMGTHIVQMIIVMLTTIFFWQILKKEFPKIEQVERMLITLAFVFTPSVLGLSSGYNLDFGTLCLVVWVLYAWSYELSIFKIIFGVLFCFTKEPAVILYIGLAIGLYLHKLITCSNKKHKIFFCLKVTEWLELSIPAIMWGCVFIAGSNAPTASGDDGWSNGGAQSIRWCGINPKSRGLFNCFGLDLQYCWIQIKHSFLMNFEWIITAIIIICLFILFIKKKKITQIKLLIPALSGITIFEIFCMLFITHPHYRYVAPICSLWLLVLVTVLSEVINDEFKRIYIYTFIAIMFFIQTFFSVDPVTNRMGHSLNIGSTKLQNYIEETSDDGIYRISDYTLYNYQGNLYGGLLNQISKEINPNNTVVLIPNQNNQMLYAALCGRALEDGHGVYIDNINGRFSPIKLDGYSKCSFGTIDEKNGNIEMLGIDTPPIDTYDNLYYIDLPFSCMSNEKTDSCIGKSGLEIINTQELGYWGGWNARLITLTR